VLFIQFHAMFLSLRLPDNVIDKFTNETISLQMAISLTQSHSAGKLYSLELSLNDLSLNVVFSCLSLGRKL
jgi:hypothetical protein